MCGSCPLPPAYFLSTIYKSLSTYISPPVSTFDTFMLAYWPVQFPGKIILNVVRSAFPTGQKVCRQLIFASRPRNEGEKKGY